MHLTRFTDLGLRLVMRLGEADRGDVAKQVPRTTVAMLADDINASYAHVARVVAALAELGVIRSERGRAGGVYLQEHAAQRSVGWLLRQLEGEGEVVNCVEPECPYASRDCLLRHRLAAAKEAFFASLDDLLLGDLIAQAASGGSPANLGLPRVSKAAKQD
ncbi:Rrf2 family transcriptional regulator [Staphylococcus chromogenes]|nr:Rrf2 family transcriptional regulator [Staphylococcus chromogenes]